MIRVAVVEDNPDTLLLVGVVLRDYALTSYTSGQAALDGILGADELPHVVLLDVSLPDLEGPEVLARLRADARMADVPIVAFTAHAMAGDRERLLALGFDDYVTKPIMDMQGLVALIGRLGGGAQERDS